MTLNILRPNTWNSLHDYCIKNPNSQFIAVNYTRGAEISHIECKECTVIKPCFIAPCEKHKYKSHIFTSSVDTPCTGITLEGDE